MSAEIIRHAEWRAPVLVRIGYGCSEAVHSASEALDLLKSRWPSERGQHYEAALRNCRAASEGAIAGEVARESFVSAALESYVFA